MKKKITLLTYLSIFSLIAMDDEPLYNKASDLPSNFTRSVSDSSLPSKKGSSDINRQNYRQEMLNLHWKNYELKQKEIKLLAKDHELRKSIFEWVKEQARLGSDICYEDGEMKLEVIQSLKKIND